MSAKDALVTAKEGCSTAVGPILEPQIIPRMVWLNKADPRLRRALPNDDDEEETMVAWRAPHVFCEV